ncbi:hypothetical protein F4774DRAFT_376499 [Daldinia eschscholtzii]|nr:hypothetical protein F4774DRAFT_376499 [Daldinia eschscholtzii]
MERLREQENGTTNRPPFVFCILITTYPKTTVIIIMSSKDNPRKSKYPPGWVQSVLRCTYNDGGEITKGLNELLGEGSYILKHRTGRWVVWASRKLDSVDETKLEKVAHVHYRA